MNFLKKLISRPALLAVFVTILLISGAAAAQNASPLNINVADDLLSSERIFHLVVLLTVLSLAPSILIMVTSFTRIVIVFALLRSAIGLQTTPNNTIIVSLALFLTAYIMAPTMQTAYQDGISPYFDGKISESEAFDRTVAPFRTFMGSQVRENDLQLFLDMLPAAEKQETYDNINNVPLKALIPAFMISELRRAFEIGFLIFLPFIVIDLTVASILMSMGMMMLPPVIISLPFKIIFFVLVDGWHLLSSSLVQSFIVSS